MKIAGKEGLRSSIGLATILWVGSFGIAAFVFGLSEAEKSRINKYGGNYKEDEQKIISTYYTKRDSLEDWYKSKIDSLQKSYLDRRNLEKLAK